MNKGLDSLFDGDVNVENVVFVGLLKRPHLGIEKAAVFIDRHELVEGVFINLADPSTMAWDAWGSVGGALAEGILGAGVAEADRLTVGGVDCLQQLIGLEGLQELVLRE